MITIQKLFDEKFNYVKKSILQYKENLDSIKNKINGFSVFSEDTLYRKHFDNNISPKIYSCHVNSNFVSCAFCFHLQKSSCHEYCHICTKETYTECSCLLPGTFNFSDNLLDCRKSDSIPWLFKAPCTHFSRLTMNSYFKHFTSPLPNITTANYEVIEGILTGMCREVRPCHICASVDINIYKKCLERNMCDQDKPCTNILNEISAIYHNGPDIIGA